MHRQTTLSHGVTVTLQILVLSFQVRILVAQREGSKFASLFLLRIFLHRPPCEKPGPVCGRFERRTVRRPAPPGFRKSRTAFARRTNLSAFRTVFRSASATPPFVQRHETARSVPPNHSLLPRPERRTGLAARAIESPPPFDTPEMKTRSRPTLRSSGRTRRRPAAKTCPSGQTTA